MKRYPRDFYYPALIQTEAYITGYSGCRLITDSYRYHYITRSYFLWVRSFSCFCLAILINEPSWCTWADHGNLRLVGVVGVSWDEICEELVLTTVVHHGQNSNPDSCSWKSSTLPLSPPAISFVRPLYGCLVYNHLWKTYPESWDHTGAISYSICPLSLEPL